MLPGDPLGRTPGTPLTPPGTGIKQTVGGNPNLKPEVAYEWTYGVVWTPAKLIKGLTLSADWYHIDLRNAIFGLNATNILVFNFDTRTGTLPNGAPTGGVFSDLIQRDPVTGAVLNVDSALQNTIRSITEGLDYEASINWIPPSSAMGTSGHSRSLSMATTCLGLSRRRPRGTQS